MAQDSSPPSMADDMTFSYELRIPKERIAVLIGIKGEAKRQLESIAQARLEIDSKEGDVTVFGKDAIKLHQLRDIIKAIGRGFNPDVAMLLFRVDYSFELINLTEYSRAKNHQVRVKGRVIGKEGKTRDIIEELTDVRISIYGKTIAVIGVIENTNIAVRAIDMLLSGSPHANVYKWLEQKRKVLKQHEMLGASVEVKDEFKKYVE